MSTLSRLLQKIENFYKLAWEASDFVSLAQDADLPDLTNDIVNLANTLENQAVASDLKMLSRDYARSVRTGMGQNSIANSVYMVMDDPALADSTPENQKVKELLAKLIDNLRERAGGYLASDETRQTPIAGPAEAVPTDAPEAYKTLIDLIPGISNPTMKDQLNLLAALYLKAVEINGGYNAINNGIEQFKLSYIDEGDEDSYAIEDALSSMQVDLIGRAGGNINKPDSPEVMRQLQEARQKMLKAETVEEAPTAFQEGLIDQPGMPRGEEGTGDGSGEVGQMLARSPEGGAGGGFGIDKGRKPRDWVKIWSDDKIIAKSKMSNSENKAIKENLDRQIKYMDKLIPLQIEKIKLENQLSSEEKPDIGDVEKLSVVDNEIKMARVRLDSLKKLERLHNLKVQATHLSSAVNSIHNPLHKLKAEQEIALNEALASSDHKKQPEIQARRKLVALLETIPNKENLPVHLHHIVDEKIAKIPALLEEIELAKIQRIPLAQRHKERAAALRERLNSGSMSSLVENLQRKLAESKVIVKQSVTDIIKEKIKKERYTELKPYIDALAQASASKNKEAVKAASQALSEAMGAKAINAEGDLHPKVVAHVAILKSFYDFRDKYKKVLAATDNELSVAIDQAIELGSELWRNYSGANYLAKSVEAVETMLNQLSPDWKKL